MDWERPPYRNQGPSGPRPPDLDEIVRRVKERFGAGGLGRGPVVAAIVVVLGLLLAFNSYYTVQPQETAVVQRFGKFVRTADAGLHFKIPFGVETVRKVVTGRVLQREYGYRSATTGVRARLAEKGFEDEARMLSGDLNVLDLQWTVQYKIQDPVQYLFRVQDVEATLDDMSESVIRRVVGNRYADEVLTVGRASVAEQARKEIQVILDHYRTGIQLVTVKLQNVNPPDPVKAAFNEVNAARQEKERMINEAQAVYNQQIPRARGEARQVVNQAEGYATEKVNRAKGDAQRFLDVLGEYRKAPEVTRTRLYLDSMVEFLPRVGRFIVVDERQEGILPFLDIGRSLKAPGGPTPPLAPQGGQK